MFDPGEKERNLEAEHENNRRIYGECPRCGAPKGSYLEDQCRYCFYNFQFKKGNNGKSSHGFKTDNSKTIHSTKKGDIAAQKVIISCPNCKQKLRVPLFKKQKICLECSRCQITFKFDGYKYRIRQRIVSMGIIVLIVLLLVADLFLPYFFIKKKSVEIKKIRQTYVLEVEKKQEQYSKELVDIEKGYKEKLDKVNAGELKIQATNYYRNIWEERSNYNSRYAITPREKAQLEMVALSKEKNRSIEEIVESIAIKASPKNSEIRAYTTKGGVNLDLNFDMAEMTTGEKGTRTKHESLQSLKKEAIRLIAKVTTDLYEICRGLELNKIVVGCKHFVSVDQEYGPPVKRDTIIYQISLKEKDIKSLEHNPFLDIYAIKKYFNIEKDEFPNLRLETI
ncbi:MAG: hypothetical protein PHQ52_01915 [Candidatus Omnitrophica bacterium]|nr:hypothetical protein [Candidatus Omnitrophota bacterium]